MYSHLLNPNRMARAGWVAGALLVSTLLVSPLTPGQDAPPQTNLAAAVDVPKEISLKVTDKITLKAVLIPAGKFLMGGPETDPNHYYDECPQHEVTLTESFYLGIYDVTEEQYEAVMGRNPSPTKGATNPVENVTWADSVEFCRKLSETSGRTVRLPTEAQWEYACRAGTTTRFSFGDDEAQLAEYGWYQDNSGLQSHPVGQKKPNPWGLYDMHGNVFQWVADTRAIVATYGSALPVTDPQGPKQNTGGRGGGPANHVLRGGSWVYPAQKSRSATRGFAGNGPWYFGYGFRVLVGVK